MCVHDVRATVNAHDEWAFFVPNRLDIVEVTTFVIKLRLSFPTIFALRSGLWFCLATRDRTAVYLSKMLNKTIIV